MKQILRKLFSENLISRYHKFLALFSSFIYGNPSEKMIVIGVTGTNGKSTTVELIAKVLEAGGYKVGVTSTVKFKVGDKEWLNDKKMTMLGRFQLQRLLKDMFKAGCKYAVVETSSQGVVQFRHLGINYDYAVFTNLTPEHIEAHGGFENYQKAKGEFFKHLSARDRKKINEITINKVSVINADDKYSKYFLEFDADKKITYGVENSEAELKAFDIDVNKTGTSFSYNGSRINLQLLGAFNVYNALAAIAVGLQENIEPVNIKRGLEKIEVVPGRMELVDEGQNFSVLVDYAPEPYSMEKLYQSVDLMKKNRIIHVLGSCGGGRDVARRPILGALAGENADLVIVTNEDPYDDDPMEIIDQVAAGALDKGKTLNENLYKILDRKEAIERALNMAQPGDLVLVTGKGSEQAMAVAGGKYIPWDDRQIIRSWLQKIDNRS